MTVSMTVYKKRKKDFFHPQEPIFFTTENQLIFQVRTLKPQNITYVPKAIQRIFLVKHTINSKITGKLRDY